MRAAIYARFSTDLQRDRSVEDQIALCKDHAAKLGAKVVSEYFDRARSGASIFGRDGLLNLMDAAKSGSFDIVIVEALDRLSRDQEDLAGIYKRLKFAGVKIEAVHDGQADAVQIGIRGMLGSLYLTDLAHKVRRGLQGVVRDGRIAGGHTYGYRPKIGYAGEFEIVPDEAEIVRRIYREYVDGSSPMEIVTRLNREGVKPPRGSLWRKPLIYGSHWGNGIIRNRLYIGEIIWNRRTYIRDPETGRKIARANPESEWKFAQAPHLVIVDREIFDAAQRLRLQRETKPRDVRIYQPLLQRKHLLAGLMFCGHCNATMVIRGKSKGRRRLQCANAIESGKCVNRRTYYLDKIEAAVLGRLSASLSDRSVIDTYLKEYLAEARIVMANARKDRERIAREKAEAEAGLARIIVLVEKNMISIDEAGSRIAEIKSRIERASGELAAAETAIPDIDLRPEALKTYRTDIEGLKMALGRPEAAKEVRESLSRLIGRVAVLCLPEPQIRIEGKLAAFIEASVPSELAFLAKAERRSDPESRFLGDLFLIGSEKLQKAA